MVEVVSGWWWWWWGGGGGDPRPFSMLLESYCSLENPLKKGSPALALARVAHYFVRFETWQSTGVPTSDAET